MSSDNTYLNKDFFFILSLVVLAGNMLGVIGELITPFDALANCVIISCICLRFAWRPKIVSTDGSFLYVSDRRKEIRIPLSDIVRVRQAFFMRWKPQHVMITLIRPSKFGKKIIFFPEGVAHDILETHPIVDELNRLVHSHKQKMKRTGSGDGDASSQTDSGGDHRSDSGK